MAQGDFNDDRSTKDSSMLLASQYDSSFLTSRSISPTSRKLSPVGTTKELKTKKKISGDENVSINF